MTYFQTIRFLTSLLIVSILFGCNSGVDDVEPNTYEPVTISLIHMNDLHAHLIPHEDVISVGGTEEVVERGGLARLATVINSIRTDNPFNVLMNVGDTFHGGAEARFSRGNAIVKPVNALGIDVGVPGNWDFAYQPISFLRRYGRLSDPSVLEPNYVNIAANVKTALRTEIMPPTWMTNVGGARVGFIGITSDIVPLMHSLLAAGFIFNQGEQEYRSMINNLAKGLRARDALIVVVLSELGLHKNYRLAQVIDPDLVDVIFTGHTHELTLTPLTSASGALVVEAGNDGYLGRMDITLNNLGEVTNRQWNVYTIDSSVAEDLQMKNLVSQVRAPFLAADVNLQEPSLASPQMLTMPINTVVGSTDVLLTRRNALENSFNNAFSDLIRSATKTQLAMTPGFRFDSVVPQAGLLLEDDTVATGDITVEDVFRLFPVHFTMGSAEASGAHIKATLEASLTRTFAHAHFKQAGGWFSGISGMDLQVDLGAPDGQRITEMRLSDTGELMSDSGLYSIAGCIRPLEFGGELCSFPGFILYKDLVNPATGKAYTGADFLIDALKNGAITTNRKNVVDITNTVMFPESEVLQPYGVMIP